MLSLKNAITLFLLLTGGVLIAQVPDGGIRLNAETGTTYQKIGKGTLTEITVADQPFTEGLRLVVGSDVSNAWDSQIKFPAIDGIVKDDVILVAFYARTTASLEETGEGALNVCVEHNVTYAKEIYHKITIGSEWKEYYASAIVGSSLTLSEVSYSFHCAFPSQTIELADVRFLNYKNTLTIDDMPVTEVTYIGQDPNADWRAPAEERISQVRKGIVDIVVYDDLGQPLPDASVSIEMVKHQFGFGTAVAANEFSSNATYRDKVLELFNEVVFENDLKWTNFNPSLANVNLNNALDTFASHDIDVRGHTVVWPSFRYCPSFLEDLSNNPVELRNAIDKRIDDVTEFTNAKVIDWDVMNEPYSEHELQDILGDEVMADWFKRVRMNDRDVKLYINDYSIISSGGTNINHQNGYYDVIEYIDSKGGNIDGIGLQGHFSTDLTPITRVYEILERFAAFGKDIKITEHDINTTQRGVQADYTRDFLTILFSHESVKSCLVWGFWANRHWKPECAFYESDWSIRPHGLEWKNLVFNKWWTPAVDTITNLQGGLSLEGFLGTYAYTIVADGMERTGTFKLDNSIASGLGNTLILSLDEGIPDNVIITTSKSTLLCEGEDITLQAPEGINLSYEWYKDSELLTEQTSSLHVDQAGLYYVKVKKGSVEISSPTIEIKVNPVPEAIITTAGELTFCEGGSVSLSANISDNLSYDWMKDGVRIIGESTTIDASEAGVYSLRTFEDGCGAISEPVIVSLLSPTDPSCSNGLGDNEFSSSVYPNPFKDSFVFESNIQSGKSSWIELYDATGDLIHRQDLRASFEKAKLEVPGPGLYIMRVNSGNEIITYKLVGE